MALTFPERMALLTQATSRPLGTYALQIEAEAFASVTPTGSHLADRGLYVQACMRLFSNLQRNPELTAHPPAKLVQLDHRLLRGNQPTQEERIREVLAELHETLADVDVDDGSKALRCYSCQALLLITMEQRRSGDEGMTMVIQPCTTAGCTRRHR